MPASVPCPKCNYLVEDAKSVKYNDRLTAEQILKMYAMSCNETSSQEAIRFSDEENALEKSDKQITQSLPNLSQKQSEIELAKPLRKLRKRVKRLKPLRRNYCDTKTNCEIPDPRVTAYIQSLLPHKPKRHTLCARVPNRVPPHMGWMWTVFATGANEKWRPGAIRRPIREIMSWFLKDFPVDTIPISRYAFCRSKSNNKKPICAAPSVEQKPVLHITKQKGEYIVTMRPLKKTCELKESVDPFTNMKPIKFRILKNPFGLFVHNLKAKLKDLGYRPCICHRPVADCVCHTFKEKNEINDLVQYECRQNCYPRGNDTLVMSDVTDSESELDFGIAPPISRLKPYNWNKPDYTHVGTQYNIDDWCLKPKISIYGPAALCRKPKLDVNKCKIMVNYGRCPQNIQPPIILPKVQKPVKEATNKKGKKIKKGKKKRKARGKRK